MKSDDVAHLIFVLKNHIQLDIRGNNGQSHPMCVHHALTDYHCTANVLREFQ